MSELYLLPENIRPADALQVLEFLNTASTPEEIATAVEFSDELDIGVRVAQRILTARERLGGFSSLEQVYAVPYVGPERFTELVVSLSSARPPRPESNGADATALAQIRQRLQSLEAQVSPAANLRLRALNTDVLLGQETVVLAELKDAAGMPLVDRELTLVTTWGVVRGRSGVEEQIGNSITVRSDHLGLCRIALSAALGETLTAVETASLSSALAILGSLQNSPRDSLSLLSQLVREYRAPGNDSLRRAIDVYFKYYGDSSATPTDSLASWPRIGVTLTAWLTPPAGQATSHIPATLLNVVQRNWFYAWLWAFQRELEQTSRLGASLADVQGEGRSGGSILTDLYSRVGGFVKAQDGLVGQQLGQQFAASSLNNLLQSGLAKFPSDERTKVLTGVTSGVKSLARRPGISSLESSRATFNQELDTRLDKLGGGLNLDAFEARVAQLERTSVTAAQLAQQEGRLLTRINETVNTRFSQFRDEQSDLLAAKAGRDQIEQLSRELVEVREQNRSNSLRVDQIERDPSVIDRRLNTLETLIARLERRGPVR